MTFKIRNKSTGLYSTGGANPRWSRAGKVWAGLNQLNNHLTLVDDGLTYEKKNNLATVYADCEIVTLIESGVEDLWKHQKNRSSK